MIICFKQRLLFLGRERKVLNLREGKVVQTVKNQVLKLLPSCTH
jgi:hypothetical protein